MRFRQNRRCVPVKSARVRIRARAHFCIHMKAQSFIKGALIISVGGIVAKLLGALYRIPLTNILGGEGMGIYQMVYPLYCLLLTVSATGIPSGLARLVSQAEFSGARASAGVLRKSLFLFSAIGIAGSAVMFLTAPAMSALQGEPGAVNAYRALAPSVFLVSVISCFRGYFQGKSNFLPTALSEIVEQAVKIGLGLFFARAFAQDVRRAVEYALFAVTASELAACAFMLILAAGDRGRRPLYRELPAQPRALSLLRVTIPVTVAAGILPLSNILDSILIVRLVGQYAENATALYGLYSGGAATLVNLPVSVCYGLAAASIPAVSAMQAEGKNAEAEERVLFAVKCTLYVALPAAAFLFLFPAQISSFLFPSVTGEEGIALAGLVRALSLAAVFLSLVQTLSACLTGRGKPKVAALSMTIAVAVKIGAELILLRIPQISVLGAAYASVGCYFVALFINLLYSIKERKNRVRVYGQFAKFALLAAAAVAAAYPFGRVHALAAFAVTAAVYVALSVLFRAFTGEELHIAWRKKHDNRRRIGV